MHVRFNTCDVFTDTRFGGNPLAVVHGAEALSTAQMQSIAREFNYSECTFVLPAEQGHTCKVRIFTPERELPFAGHPNVGTAFALASTGALGPITANHEVVFEELAGLIPVSIAQQADHTLLCELKAPAALTLGDTFDPDKIADALSLKPSDICSSNHAPQHASVGLRFLITEVASREALAAVQVKPSLLAELTGGDSNPALLMYTHSRDQFDIRCRMFSQMGGLVEDPATGSANCALVGLLTHCLPDSDGEFSWRIAQGVEMNRPSVLLARTEKLVGTVTGVWIGGQSVMVSEGKIEI